MARPKAPAPKWEQHVGLDPYVVVVYERPERKNRIYIRWWRGDNWEVRSLRFTIRRADGSIDEALAAKAYTKAGEKYEVLSGQKLEAASGKRARLLTIGETWAVLSDPETGRYPTAGKYQKVIRKALEDAARILGADVAWAHFTRDALRKLTRQKASEVMTRGGVGFHDAEDLGSAILTIIRGLQQEGKVPDDVAVPSGHGWHEELRRFVEEKRGAAIPEPQRPRHALADVLKLFAACWARDPRLGLLYSLGAELRAGQVERARRSAIDLTAGTFAAPKKGKKGAPLMELTPGQRAAVERALTGYLCLLEADYLVEGIDYYLFPAGRLSAIDGEKRATARHRAKGHVTARTFIDWFHDAERSAGITPVRGRAFYGTRRGLTDAFADLDASEDVLQQAFGWSDRRMADDVYRDRERLKARSESAVLRARIRGEEAPST